MIPRIIHQTWKDHDIPERFRAAQASWRTAHPDWEYRFWTDEDLERLVAERAPGAGVALPTAILKTSRGSTPPATVIMRECRRAVWRISTWTA